MAGPASFRTVSPVPVLPPKTVVRGDLPATLLALLPVTRGTHSKDVVNL